MEDYINVNNTGTELQCDESGNYNIISTSIPEELKSTIVKTESVQKVNSCHVEITKSIATNPHIITTETNSFSEQNKNKPWRRYIKRSVING